MDSARFQPGFRLTTLDRIVLPIGGVATLTASQTLPWLGFVLGFVITHFFLFCNVFRMSRMLELVWSGLFLLLAGGTLATGLPGWPATAAISLAAAAGLVMIEMSRPWYHGVGWQWINPNLRHWWEQRRERRGPDSPRR